MNSDANRPRKLSACISWLYNDLEVAERVARAALDGFDGIEMQFPQRVATNELVRSIQQHAMPFVMMNSESGSASGDCGLASVPDRRDEFVQTIERAARLAVELQCTMVHVLAGPHRGAATMQHAIDGFNSALDILAASNIRLMIEPITAGDTAGYAIPNYDVAFTIAESLGDGAAVVYDTFQAAACGSALETLSESDARQIGHVQISEPGTRDVPTAATATALNAQLRRLGYEGWVGGEYRATNAVCASMEWAEPMRGVQR